MSPREIFALRDYLSPELKGRTISDSKATVSLTDALSQSCLGGRTRELSGRSVLLSVSTQLIAALAMIELDGVAKRMLLCPPDIASDHLSSLIADAEIDAVVTDNPAHWAESGIKIIVVAQTPLRTATRPRTERATSSNDTAGFSTRNRFFMRLIAASASSSSPGLWSISAECSL